MQLVAKKIIVSGFQKYCLWAIEGRVSQPQVAQDNFCITAFVLLCALMFPALVRPQPEGGLSADGLFEFAGADF